MSRAKQFQASEGVKPDGDDEEEEEEPSAVMKRPGMKKPANDGAGRGRGKGRGRGRGNGKSRGRGRGQGAGQSTDKPTPTDIGDECKGPGKDELAHPDEATKDDPAEISPAGHFEDADEPADEHQEPEPKPTKAKPKANPTKAKAKAKPTKAKAKAKSKAKAKAAAAAAAKTTKKAAKEARASKVCKPRSAGKNAGEDEAGEKVKRDEKSFARRWRPSGKRSSDEWEVLRNTFDALVRPHVASASRAEDMQTCTYMDPGMRLQSHLKCQVKQLVKTKLIP